MESRKFSMQCRKIGITEKNANSNLLTYSEKSIFSLEVAKNGISCLDSEATRYINLAIDIFHNRTKLLIAALLYDYGVDEKGIDQNIYLKASSSNLISYYLSQDYIEVEEENDDEILGGIKKALDDKTDISGINSDLIYSLAAILRSEKEILSTRNSGIVSENKERISSINTIIFQSANTIYSLISHALRIIEAKLMKSNGYYICKKCGFKMLPNDSINKCKICGNDFSNLC